MFPFSLILAMIMAGLVVVIIALLFRQLSRGEQGLEKHTLDMSTLKDAITRKDEEIKEAADEKDRLQKGLDAAKKEAENLKNELKTKTGWLEKELTEKKNLTAQLGRQKEQLIAQEKELTEKKNLTAQMEQQKRQVTEQVIKSKKLEKDLHAKQDEITVLEQKNKKFQQEQEAFKKELDKAKKALEQPKPEPPKPEPPKPEPPKPEPKPAPKPEPPKPPEPKPQQPGSKPPKEKDEQKQSPFSQFLKPKISEEKPPESTEGERKPEESK